MKAKMYDHIMKGTPTMESLEASVLIYEKKEKASLVELAILKASICDNIYFDSLQEIRDYSILEKDFEPYRFIKERRIICGSEVIVPLVMAFL